MNKLTAQFTRFLGIGFLNTAVDFAVLNILMFASGIFVGSAVGVFSSVSFVAAVTHSYFWNRHLVFKKTRPGESLFSNLGVFIYAGVLGAVVIVAVGYGAALKYSPWFYGGLLAVLAVGEIIFWQWFQIGKNTAAPKSNREFVYFVLITLVGLLLNASIVVLFTTRVPPQLGVNQQLWTNFAKALATGVSLMWNFAGYRFFLFNK